MTITGEIWEEDLLEENWAEESRGAIFWPQAKVTKNSKDYSENLKCNPAVVKAVD